MKNKNLEIYFKFFFSEPKAIPKETALELFFNEHFEEIRHRCFQLLSIFFFAVFIAFLFIKEIVFVLQSPIENVRFFQLSPGEYFVSTLKIACYTGLVFSTPVILAQLLFFFVPSFNIYEKKSRLGLIFSSILLFWLGLNFSYYVLVPAALKFFVSYGSDIIEPIWSFNQYFSFTSVLFFSTALVFQVPIFQIILSMIGVINPKKMLSIWKYIGLASTILGAILTPSIDPTTQLLLSGVLFFLYLGGGYVSLLITQTNL